jgi:DNA transposition AAA+ family ATPase
MNKFIATKQHKQFTEFCKACNRDNYIGLCYGPAGAGKTESAKHYTKSNQVTKHLAQTYYRVGYQPPKFSISRLNSVLYTPSSLSLAKNVITEITNLQRKFNWAKERFFYPQEIPPFIREENKNFAELILIDEAERLRPQSFELLREMYDEGKANFVFIGMPGIEKILERFPQLYSRIGFVHQFKNLNKDEVTFILKNHLGKLSTEIDDTDFCSQEVISSIVMITNGNFRLINRLIKQSLRIMKVNYMTTITKEIVDAARSCLLIGEK